MLVAAAAATTAASAATGHGRGHDAAVALQPEDGELASDVTALARGAGDVRRGAVDVLLEIVPAAATPVFVDRHRLLAAALHVALHELLGVFLEDVVDLVKELVDVLLDLLALLRDLGTGGSAFAAAFVRLGRPCFLLLLLCHRGPSMGSQPRRVQVVTPPRLHSNRGPLPCKKRQSPGAGGSARSACSGSGSGAGTTRPAPLRTPAGAGRGAARTRP